MLRLRHVRRGRPSTVRLSESRDGRGVYCRSPLRHHRVQAHLRQGFPPLHVTPFAESAVEWDAFGASQAGWTAFHRLAWRDVISSVFGHEFTPLAARDDAGALRGILPLCRVRSRLFGHFLVSMPFVSYGGPLGDDAAVRALASAADALARESGASLLEFRSARPLPLDWAVSHRKIAVVLPVIPGDPAATFKAFPSKLRSQVRRPDKSAVEFRDGHGQIPHFHAVFARHMRDLGTPSLPLAWFEALGRAFGDDLWVNVAWLEGIPIAGGVGFRWRDEFEMTWASSLRSHATHAPNMGVYWRLIERASREGLRRFNFGRCTPGGATHRFKSQWGAVDEDLHWYRGPSSRADATPRPDSPKWSLATRAWQRLPLGIANALGPRIVRFLP